METKRWDVSDHVKSSAITAAADLLIHGETVAFPTETVYGLGADATNADAVAKIFIAKGRPQDNPLIAHVATKAQLLALVTEVPAYAEQLIDAFTPGAITFVLPSNGTCANNVTAGLPSIAVRIPDHPVAQQLLKACELPIAAPSANVSGKPSPTTADHVWHDLQGKISGLLDGGPTGIGMESTVVSCLDPSGPVILRPGGVTQEAIETVLKQKLMTDDVTVPRERPEAPGMKYQHYAPDVPLMIVPGAVAQMQAAIDAEQAQHRRVGVIAQTSVAKKLRADQVLQLGDSLDEVAGNLYDALRAFSADQVDVIISESFAEVGIGLAIMNRLNKAAHS